MMSENIPKNKEIITNIERVKEKVEETKHDKKVNKKGEKLLSKTENILEDVQEIVKAKNPNDRLQKMIKESVKLYDDMTQTNEKWYSLKSDFNRLESDELKHQLNNLRINARILALELFRSTTFRRDIYDLYSLLFMLFTPNEFASSQRSSNQQQQRQQQQQQQHQQQQMQRMKGGLTKDQVVAQFNKVLKDISSKQSTQDALDSFINMVSIIRRLLKHLAKTAEKEADTMNPHLQKIFDLTCDLIQSSTNYNPKKLKAHFKQLYNSITNDPEIESLIKDMSHYLQDQFKHPENIGNNEATRKIEDFYNRGRRIAARKTDLAQQFNQIEEEMYEFMSMMSNDRLLNKARNDIKELMSIIMFDNQGNFVLKPEVLRQLRIIFFITFLQNMRFPLPAIIIDRGESLRARISGVAIAVHEMLPDKVTAHNEGDLVVSLTELEKKGETPDVKKARGKLTIKLENMNIKIPSADIEFSRDRFPSVEETGRVAIKVGGNGMDMTIALLVDTKMSSNKIFELDTVDCVLHDLDIQLSDTKHDTLYNATIKMFKPMFKRAIENQMQENIVSVLEEINRLLVEQKRVIQERLNREIEKVEKKLET